MINRACFLDRDGVINAEVNYLHEPEKVIILPGVVDALRLLREHQCKIIVVTNQAGVAKNLYGEADILAVHQRIADLIAPFEVNIDAFYYCPHHPDHSGECECRKPMPGMLLRAAREHNIDLSQSAMIGDRLSDIEAGRNAGCKFNCLVKTGYGREVIAKHDVSGIIVADNILFAVEKFLGLD